MARCLSTSNYTYRLRSRVDAETSSDEGTEIDLSSLQSTPARASFICSSPCEHDNPTAGIGNLPTTQSLAACQSYALAQMMVQPTLLARARLFIPLRDRPGAQIKDRFLREQITFELQQIGVQFEYNEDLLDLTHFLAWLYVTSSRKEAGYVINAILTMYRGYLSTLDEPSAFMAEDPILWGMYQFLILGKSVEAKVRSRRYEDEVWLEDATGTFDNEFASKRYLIHEWELGRCVLQRLDSGEQRVIRFGIRQILEPGNIRLLPA